MKLDHFPPEIHDDLRKAIRLEYWHIAWSISIIAAMGLAMGSSQTMKTAWVEDTLALIPPIVFLVAIRFEARGPTRLFPFGFHRVHSFAFLIAAVALAGVGLLLLWDAISVLVAREHATVGSIHLFGRDLWSGWVMLAAIGYSIFPPLIIGWKQMPLAERLQDEVIFTDAKMNKANWMTGAAGLFGVLGLGLGWWWADSVAAAIISFDIIFDGWKALRVATAELVDGIPRKLGGIGPDPEAEKLVRALNKRFPGGEVRLRETGRYIHAEISGVEPAGPQDLKAVWPGAKGRNWRLAQLSFVPPGADSAAGDDDA